MDAELLEDVRQILEEGPMPVGTLIRGLRRSLRYCGRRAKSGRRWRISEEQFFERELHEAGFELRQRRHGSGFAVYVGLAPFEQVPFYHGTERSVLVHEWRCSAAFCPRCDGDGLKVTPATISARNIRTAREQEKHGAPEEPTACPKCGNDHLSRSVGDGFLFLECKCGWRCEPIPVVY